MHERRSTQKEFQTQFPGSAGFPCAFLAPSVISKLLLAFQKCVLIFPEKMHSLSRQGIIALEKGIPSPVRVLNRAHGTPRIAPDSIQRCFSRLFQVGPSQLPGSIYKALRSLSRDIAPCVVIYTVRNISCTTVRKLTVKNSSWDGPQIALANNTEHISCQGRIELAEGIDTI